MTCLPLLQTLKTRKCPRSHQSVSTQPLMCRLSSFIPHTLCRPRPAGRKHGVLAAAMAVTVEKGRRSPLTSHRVSAKVTGTVTVATDALTESEPASGLYMALRRRVRPLQVQPTPPPLPLVTTRRALRRLLVRPHQKQLAELEQSPPPLPPRWARVRGCRVRLSRSDPNFAYTSAPTDYAYTVTSAPTVTISLRVTVVSGS